MCKCGAWDLLHTCTCTPHTQIMYKRQNGGELNVEIDLQIIKKDNKEDCLRSIPHTPEPFPAHWNILTLTTFTQGPMFLFLIYILLNPSIPTIQSPASSNICLSLCHTSNSPILLLLCWNGTCSVSSTDLLFQTGSFFFTLLQVHLPLSWFSLWWFSLSSSLDSIYVLCLVVAVPSWHVASHIAGIFICWFSDVSQMAPEYGRPSMHFLDEWVYEWMHGHARCHGSRHYFYYWNLTLG